MFLSTYFLIKSKSEIHILEPKIYIYFFFCRKYIFSVYVTIGNNRNATSTVECYIGCSTECIIGDVVEMTFVGSVLQQHWLLLKVDVVQASVYFCVVFLMNISIWPLRREADACWQRSCGGAAVVEWAEVMHQRDKQPEFMSVLAAAGPWGDERTGSTESPTACHKTLLLLSYKQKIRI